MLIPFSIVWNLGFGLRGPPGFLQAVLAANGDDARGAALVILAILASAAGGTALAAPFVASGLLGPALVAFAHFSRRGALPCGSAARETAPATFVVKSRRRRAAPEGATPPPVSAATAASPPALLRRQARLVEQRSLRQSGRASARAGSAR